MVILGNAVDELVKANGNAIVCVLKSDDERVRWQRLLRLTLHPDTLSNILPIPDPTPIKEPTRAGRMLLKAS